MVPFRSADGSASRETHTRLYTVMITASQKNSGAGRIFCQLQHFCCVAVAKTVTQTFLQSSAGPAVQSGTFQLPTQLVGVGEIFGMPCTETPIGPPAYFGLGYRCFAAA